MRDAVATTLVGQTELLERLLVGLLCDGHVLVEGVPGLGKTLAVSAFSQALGLTLGRVQFTPDLLPADLTGTMVLQPGGGEFAVRRGPIFAQVVIADEINRAPPKVQSALLQAMQEREVTIGDATHRLPRPFLVLATQNPIESDGTYALPEAQLDRFLLQVRLDYPEFEDERAILRRHGAVADQGAIAAVVSPAELGAGRAAVDGVFVDPKVEEYLLRLIRATRDPAAVGLGDLASWLRVGASTRAALALLRSARAYAWIHGRDFVVPGDVQALAADVLRHRLVLSFEALAQERSADQLIERFLDAVAVP